MYPAQEYPGDVSRASWLPNQYVANLWRNYTRKEPRATIEKPTRPYKWGGGFAQDPSSFEAGPATLEAVLASPPAEPPTFYDGDVKLGVATVSPDGKRATLANVELKPGLRVLVLMAGSMPLSRPAGLVVIPRKP